MKYREYKFRAWNKEIKKMYEVIKIDFYNEKVGYLFADPITQGEAIGYFKFSDIELMQYTGLKDKNGVEIYEGDIVTVIDEILGSPFCDGITGKIVYDEAAFLIVPKNVLETQWLFNECAFYEVIGNIYDNPELIEEKGNKKEGLANWGIEKTSSLRVKPTQKI